MPKMRNAEIPTGTLEIKISYLIRNGPELIKNNLNISMSDLFVSFTENELQTRELFLYTSLFA